MTAAIRAELQGDGIVAVVDGVRIFATGHAPALELCRALIDMGLDSDRPLEVFRGKVLVITVRSIASGAQLRVVDRGSGPAFERAPPTRIPAPPIAPVGGPLPSRQPRPKSHHRACSDCN
jgi:hypothetical protein